MSQSHKCPACQGTRLRPGEIPDSGEGWTNRLRFKPDGNWLTTHQLFGLACTDCGHVSLWLNIEEARSLR